MSFKRLWRPLPIAALVTAVGAVEYRRIHYGENEAKQWEITGYSCFPLRVISRGWGWICQKELPVYLRTAIYSRYSKMFDVNINEAVSQDFTSYPSLCDFFCRELREGVRPIDSEEPVVSPADGAILNVGQIVSPKVEQIKGVTYSLKAFLGEKTWDKDQNNVIRAKDPTKTSYLQSLLKNKDNVLYQCVIYLAPGDYHRFHSPVDWTVQFRRHFPGKLFSVNPKIARWIPDLFSLNERAVYIGEWQHGFFSFTAVGATNVGSICVYSDQSLKTNQCKWCKWQTHHDYEKFFSGADGKPLSVRKDCLSPCHKCRRCSPYQDDPRTCECGCEIDMDLPGCRYPSPPVVLAAQIVLGAALVVSMAALVSVILRMCTRNPARARARRETQRSATSVDVFVAQRLHDCPPHYDDISWEKPPSYAALPPPEAQVSLGEVAGPSPSPPSYEAPVPVFTVSEVAAQILSEGEASGSTSDAGPLP